MSSNESSSSVPTAHIPSSESTTDLGPVGKKVEADDAAGIGQVIDNRYRITRKLGEGGMGEVYAAEHVHIAKKVAIKLLRREILDNKEAVQRFYQEARSASSIGHENIIAIEDFGTLPDGRIYLCMELLEGEPLNDMLEKDIAPDRMLDILIQTCHGLAAAHAKSIVHRDMKPDNIFVTRDPGGRDIPKLLDFGIAKVQGTDGDNNLTRTGTIFGTPFYMAPEQALGQGIDHRADVYAMGVIMYEIFTGSVPYQGESFMAILTKRITSDPDRPEDRAAANGRSILPGIGAIIERAMTRDVGERYQTMDELTADLVSLRRSIIGAGMSAYMAPHTGDAGDSTVGAGHSSALYAPASAQPTPVPSVQPTPVPSVQTPPRGSSAPAHPSGGYNVGASSSFPAMPEKKGSKAGLIAAIIIMLTVAGGIAAFVLMSGGEEEGPGETGTDGVAVTDTGEATGDGTGAGAGDGISGDQAGTGDVDGSGTGATDGSGAGEVDGSGAGATDGSGTGEATGDATVITPPPAVKVLVASVPNKVEVERDGEKIGITPLLVDVVPGQPVILELSKSRYLDKAVTVDGTKERVEFKLARRPTKKKDKEFVGSMGMELE